MVSAILSDAEMERYSRNIKLREIGVEGQGRLLDSRVLLIGAGALGSAAAQYLAAAGVGTLGIVDGDHVELSNLQRQILHTTAGVGLPKTASAQRQLQALNPGVRINAHQTVIASDNALDLIRGYDVVINGSDNFPTRYLVNDACVLLRKPLVDASILMWEAQAAVFMPGQGCYRCLYPAPPPPGSVPSCSEAGVIGAMAGHLGTLQALETVKILLGVGETLADRLLLIDMLAGDYHWLRRRRNPQCPVCGDAPVITELIDYHEFCGVPGHTLPAPQLSLSVGGGDRGALGGAALRDLPADWIDPPGLQISPTEARPFMQHPAVQWIDVREPNEYRVYRIPGCSLIPLGQIQARAGEIRPEQPVIVVCESGMRSLMVVEALRRVGYGRAYNLDGGMLAWLNWRLPAEKG